MKTKDIPTFSMIWIPNKDFKCRFGISPHDALKIKVYAIEFVTSSFRLDDERKLSLYLRGMDHYLTNPEQEYKNADLN